MEETYKASAAALSRETLTCGADVPNVVSVLEGEILEMRNT